MKLRFFAINAKNVCNIKPTLGIAIDPHWLGMVEIRLMLIWWHIGLWIGDEPYDPR